MSRSDSHFSQAHLIKLGTQEQSGNPKLQAASAQLQQPTDTKELINHIVRQMRRTLILDEVLQTTAVQLQAALQVTCCLVDCLVSPSEPATCHISPDTVLEKPLVNRIKELFQYYHEALSEGNAVVFSQMDAGLPHELQTVVTECGIRSLLIFPLLYEQSYLGEIGLYQSHDEHQWTVDELTLLEAIADHCAVTIYQCNLYQQVKIELSQSQRTEEALLDNTCDLLEILQAFPDLYLRLDAKGTLLSCYTNYRSDLFLQFNLCLKKNLLEVLPLDIWNQWHQAILQVLSTSLSVTIDYSLPSAEGEKYFEARFLPSPENQILVIIRDITQAKQAEKALRDQEALYHQMFESNQAIQLLIDPTSYAIVDANPAAAQFYGYSLESLKRMNINEINVLSQEQINPEIVQATSQNLSYFVFRHQLFSGEIRDVEVYSSLINIQGRQLLYSIIHDITNRKQVEAALQIAKDELETKVQERTAELQQEINDRIWAETLVAGQNHILELIATGKGLTEILSCITQLVEEQSGEVYCSILLVDQNGLNLRYSAAPSLPESYNGIINDLLIGRNVYACSTVSEYKTSMGGSDIATDSQGQLFKDLALAYGIQACWSTPIITTNEKVLGTFVLYYRTPRPPNLQEHKLVEIFTHLAGIAIERNQVEESLRRSEEKFRNLVEQTNDWVWELDQDGIFIYVNPQLVNILGYEPHEVLGKSYFDLMSLDQAKRVATVLDYFTSNHEPFRNIEQTLIHKQGHTIIFETSGTPVFDAQGQLQGYRGIGRDITEHKQVEQEIRKALSKEKELSELKSRFVTMTSHEFRTPLSTILSSTELLEHYSYKLTEEKKLRHLRRIQTAVHRMTQMLNDVLVIGKAEVGKLEFNPAPLDLSQFCQDLVEEMQLTTGGSHIINLVETGKQESVVLSVQVPQDNVPKKSFEQTLYYLDEKLLRHIFNNLLSNAIKYSPPGSTIHFQVTYDKHQASFQIQDHGIGIPAKDLKRLFDSFYRATNVGTIPGTGLGLAVVKKCVDLQGGSIMVESTLGVGTLFKVALPLRYVFS